MLSFVHTYMYICSIKCKLEHVYFVSKVVFSCNKSCMRVTEYLYNVRSQNI